MGDKLRLFAKRSSVLLLCLAVVSILPGCWDRRELEDLGLVMVIGIDKSQTGEFMVTFQIAIPRKIGGEGGGEGPGTEVISLEACSLLGALNLSNAFIGRRLTLMHARALVIGEEFARDNEYMDRIIGPLLRYREIRRNMIMITVKGKAVDFIKANQPTIDINPAKFIDELASNYGTTGMLPQSTYLFYVRDLEQYGATPYTLLGASKPKAVAKEGEHEDKSPVGTRNYIAGTLPREGGPKVELLGTAVYRLNKWVGSLGGEETRILNMLTGTFRQAYMPFPDPQKPDTLILIDMRQGTSPGVKVNIEGQKPVIQVNLSLEGDLLGIQSNIDYVTKQGAQQSLERHVSRIIHTRALALVRKSKEDFKADIFGFGNAARPKFLTWDQWANYNWPDKFPEAEVHVKVDFRIRRIGMMMKPPEKN